MDDPDEQPSAMADLAALIPEEGDQIAVGGYVATNAGFWSDGEGYDDPLMVCTVHRRFLPCRARDGCVYSVDPADVEVVRRYQQGGKAMVDPKDRASVMDELFRNGFMDEELVFDFIVDELDKRGYEIVKKTERELTEQ